MKKSYKKILISIFIFLIFILLSISIIMANNTNIEEIEIDKEKIYYEIKYLDYEIIYMINLLNNIEGKNDFYINWYELENKTYRLYDYWNSAILDLNLLSLDKSSLTDYGKNLDELLIAIKSNDKDNTFNNLLELYNKLVIYSETLDYDNNYNKILITRYNLLCAYSVAEKGNWTLTHEYILKASEIFLEVVNSMENNKYNQYNVNQAYIGIKELENIINIKNIDVFYLKYNIAINKLNIL